MEKIQRAVCDIIIHKKNDVFLQVECERSIARELNDFFSFWVPEAKYMPAYKSRMWDGKIRLFDSRVNQIYVGLSDYLREFADKRNYSIEGGDWSTMTHTGKMLSHLSLVYKYPYNLETIRLMPYIMQYEMGVASLLVLLHQASH